MKLQEMITFLWKTSKIKHRNGDVEVLSRCLSFQDFHLKNVGKLTKLVSLVFKQ
jgi:hypothetical protein